MAENSDEILHDFFPMARVYKDGRIERLLGQDIVPPSLDPTTGVQSKDVEIAPEMNLSARLFLPPNASPGQKLPLLVYFHGGGFIVESAFSAPYHKHLNHLVAEANVIAVSVNYRLAPEHPLPIAFEDSWHCLKWAASQSTDEGGEEWIKEYADSDRVYLGGDSAGANIAHKLAMRAGSEKPEGFNLRGIFLNCPYFWGVDLLGSEADHPMKAVTENLWFVVCPGTTGHDEPWINPGKDPNVSRLGCKKVLIYVGEKDMLRERGWYYKEVLKKSGWVGEVECVEAAGEGHVFSVFSPDSESSILMFRKVASFINN